jgi:hypothetical protein
MTQSSDKYSAWETAPYLEEIVLLLLSSMVERFRSHKLRLQLGKISGECDVSTDG